MADAYVEEYARKRGISVAEAMEHAVIKEYLKSHSQDADTKEQVTETKILAGCGGAGDISL